MLTLYPLSLLLSGPVGADVPETKASGGKGEATSRAGALQEVFDAATDTLAKRQPLQGLPSQVTPTRPPYGPQARPAPLSNRHQSLFFTARSTWLHGGEHAWLDGMNEWIIEWMEWMDRWMMQDRTVKDRRCCGQPGTEPRATSVCQCSQPWHEWECGTGAPEDQHKHTQRNTHAPASHSISSPCRFAVRSLHPSPPQLHRQSCQWGSSWPPRAVVKRLECSKGFWPVGTEFYRGGHMSFLNWKCTYE